MRQVECKALNTIPPTEYTPALKGRRGASVVSRRRILGVASAFALGELSGCTEDAQHPPSSSSPRHSHRPSIDMTGHRKPYFGALVGAPDDQEVSFARWKTDIDTLASHKQTLVRVGPAAGLLAPSRGTWSDKWTKVYQEAFRYARHKGLRVYLILAGVPDWAQHYSHDEYRVACQEFWTGMAKRFGHLVDIWQLFNEADASDYQTFEDVQSDDKDYFRRLRRLLKSGRAIFHQYDGKVTTNLYGWPVDDSQEHRWRTVLDQIHTGLDIIGLDLYPADNKKQIRLLPGRVQRVEKRYDIPVFVAEIGLQVAGQWDAGDQENFLPAAIRSVSRARPYGVALYELRDSHGSGHFGIEKTNGSRKPSFGPVMAALG